jgi:predicted Zn-dependent protease
MPASWWEMLDVPATLLAAIRHQQAAHYAQAETLYREVLADAPDHPHAICLYGLLQLGTGQTAPAMNSLGRAAMLRPWHLAARLGLGRAVGRGPGRRRAGCRGHVAGTGPGQCAGGFFRGTALSTLGRPGDAIVVLRQAIAADPADAAAHLNLGNAPADLDELEVAEADVRRAIALDRR